MELYCFTAFAKNTSQIGRLTIFFPMLNTPYAQHAPRRYPFLAEPASLSFVAAAAYNRPPTVRAPDGRNMLGPDFRAINSPR